MKQSLYVKHGEKKQKKTPEKIQKQKKTKKN